MDLNNNKIYGWQYYQVFFCLHTLKTFDFIKSLNEYIKKILETSKISAAQLCKIYHVLQPKFCKVSSFFGEMDLAILQTTQRHTMSGFIVAPVEFGWKKWLKHLWGT